MKKRVFLAFLIAIAIIVLCGCGKLSEEDAKLYAESVLDASYKGEFEEYIKQTDSTEEEARNAYESNLDALMKESGFEEAGISEELQANYRQLFQDMLKSAKYHVGDAKEDTKDSFTIDVTVSAFTAFAGISEETNNWLTEQFVDATEVPEEAELNEMFFQKMYELMAAKISDPAYGEEMIVTIHVKPDSDGVYYIPDEDLTAIDSALFPEDQF